jgi:hypothetical protein
MPEEFKEYESPEKMYCIECDVETFYEKKQCGPHLGAYCIHCTKKIKHLKKLKNINKRTTANNDHVLKDKYSRGFEFCAICYRPLMHIFEKTGLKLEVHHIKEVQHGGDNDPENLLCVCCDCHNMIHSVRMITHRNNNTWKL